MFFYGRVTISGACIKFFVSLNARLNTFQIKHIPNAEMKRHMKIISAIINPQCACARVCLCVCHLLILETASLSCSKQASIQSK